ncbi:MAG: hypothetical protein Kow0069_21980 [Promethearchaeota archaeon]
MAGEDGKGEATAPAADPEGEPIRGRRPPEETLVITDPEAVPALFHEKRLAIMRLLVSGEFKIVQLKEVLRMNPGTVKRHLEVLLQHGLVVPPRVVVNKYGIREKYYVAAAKRFKVRIDWP